MTFGEKLRQYRTKQKMTQQEAAQGAGISRRTYLYYESGEKYPRSKETVQRLADLFGVDINRLLPEDDEYLFQQFHELPADKQEELFRQMASVFFQSRQIPQVRKQLVFENITALYQQAADTNAALEFSEP